MRPHDYAILVLHVENRCYPLGKTEVVKLKPGEHHCLVKRNFERQVLEECGAKLGRHNVADVKLHRYNSRDAPAAHQVFCRTCKTIAVLNVGSSA